MAVITTRVPPDLLKEIKKIEREEGADRSAVLRRLLARAVQQWRLERALQSLRDGKVTLRTAAKMAGLRYVEMLEQAERAAIDLGYDLEELRRDLAIRKTG